MKVAFFQQKIAYIAEEVGDCQISDSKSFILNKKSLILNAKDAHF